MKRIFKWDKVKAQTNLKDHKISFETATFVFDDQFAITEQDRFENGEYRWQTIGLVNGYLVLLVAHTVFDDEDGTEVVRIVSARRADKKERKYYERNRTLYS